jgi:hypothetical protein
MKAITPNVFKYALSSTWEIGVQAIVTAAAAACSVGEEITTWLASLATQASDVQPFLFISFLFSLHFAFAFPQMSFYFNFVPQKLLLYYSSYTESIIYT